MGKNIRFILLGIQAFITLLLTFAIFHATWITVQLGTWETAQSHLLPSLINLWFALVAALLLCFLYRANVGAEARVLPLLFLMISLSNIKILPLYQAITHTFILSASVISIAYHFALLFSSFLFLASGLFQQTITPIKLGQYSFFGAASALLLSILVPVSINNPAFLWEAGITNRLFLGVCILVNALAVFAFVIVMFDKNLSRQSFSRCLAFILMIIGNAMVAISQGAIINTIGLIFYVAGVTTLILVTRTYHIWA